jgi:hypothetical protein
MDVILQSRDVILLEMMDLASSGVMGVFMQV